MKKVEFGLIMLILLVIALMACGCQEQLADKPDLRRELLVRLPVEWVNRYGDDLESRQTANIVRAIQVINNQAQAIKQLDERLTKEELSHFNEDCRTEDERKMGYDRCYHDENGNRILEGARVRVGIDPNE